MHAHPGTSFLKLETEQGLREVMIAFYKIISAMKKIHRGQEPSVSSDTRISKQSMKSTLQV